MDGIDAALVRFGDSTLDMIATHQLDYPAEVRRQLLAERSNSALRYCNDVPELHQRVGECFRDAANELLTDAGQDASSVAAVGSHGQTLRHEPNAIEPFSLQIGDPDVIASGTGITTIADFRRDDIELGGQGAPLAPAFHEWLFHHEKRTRVVLNIGGIANITVLPGEGADTIGFDTGPGNTLLDAWHEKHRRDAFDHDGAWAASGAVDGELLARLLADQYFAVEPPKSTGFEYFNLDWLSQAGTEDIQHADVQATLCELTARSIAAAIAAVAPGKVEVLVCGGGVHNAELMRRLASAMPATDIRSTASAGLDPDWVEAAAFAWLAMRRMQELSGNLPSVTGARRAAVLGTVHAANELRTP